MTAADASVRLDERVEVVDEPPERRRRVSPRLQTAILVVPSLILAERAWDRRWLTDDGFINLRITKNIVEGHGPVFNAGERVEAATSTLWVWLLASADIVLPRRLEQLALVLGLGLAVAGLLLATFGAARLHRSRGATGLLLPAGALVVVVLPPFWDFSTSGLEGGLTFGWLGLVAWLLARWATSDGRLGGWAAAIIGLAPLVRPDLAVGDPRVARGRPRRPVARRLLARPSGLIVQALAIPVAYQVFRMGYYGSLLPNTGLAKSGVRSRWDLGWAYLQDFADPYVLYLPLACLFLVIWAPLVWRATRALDRRGVVFLTALPAVGLVNGLYFVRVGGDYMHGRLLLPAMFALVTPLCAVPVTRVAGWRVPRRVRPRRTAPATVPTWTRAPTRPAPRAPPPANPRGPAGPGSSGPVPPRWWPSGRSSPARSSAGSGPRCRCSSATSGPARSAPTASTVSPRRPRPVRPPRRRGARGRRARVPAGRRRRGRGAPRRRRAHRARLVRHRCRRLRPRRRRLHHRHAGFGRPHRQPLRARGAGGGRPREAGTGRLAGRPGVRRHGAPRAHPPPAIGFPLYVSPAGQLSADAAAARHAVDCGELADLHEAVHDDLTVGRFLQNIWESPRLTRLEVPPTPTRPKPSSAVSHRPVARTWIVADRIEVGVVACRRAELLGHLDGAPEVVERIARPAREALAAREVEEQHRVLRSGGHDPAQPVGDLGVLARLVQRGERRPELPATGLVALARRAFQQNDRRPFLHGRGRSPSGGGAKTRVPAGASTWSPSSSNTAWPAARGTAPRQRWDRPRRARR